VHILHKQNNTTVVLKWNYFQGNDKCFLQKIDCRLLVEDWNITRELFSSLVWLVNRTGSLSPSRGLRGPLES
jgi:hypothetical protein